MKSDNQLNDLLNTLQDVPPRDLAAIEQGRENFLAQAEMLQTSRVHDDLSLMQKLLAVFSTPMVRRAAVGFAAVVIFILISGSGVIFAAEQSLPGENLYGVKLTVEKVRLQNPFLAPEGKEELLFNFAQTRVEEMEQLVELERYEDLETGRFHIPKLPLTKQQHRS